MHVIQRTLYRVWTLFYYSYWYTMHKCVIIEINTSHNVYRIRAVICHMVPRKTIKYNVLYSLTLNPLPFRSNAIYATILNVVIDIYATQIIRCVCYEFFTTMHNTKLLNRRINCFVRCKSNAVSSTFFCGDMYDFISK